MDKAFIDRPLVATVTLTPIGAGMVSAADSLTIILDHEANAEVCAAVMRLMERRTRLDGSHQ